MDKDIIVSGGLGYYLVLVRDGELRFCFVKNDPNQNRPDLRDMWRVKQQKSRSWWDERIDIKKITGWAFKDSFEGTSCSLMIFTGKRVHYWGVQEDMIKPVRAMMMEIAGNEFWPAEEEKMDSFRHTVLSVIVYGLTILHAVLFWKTEASGANLELEKWMWLLSLLIPPYCCVLYHLFPDEVTDINSSKSRFYRVPVWLPVLFSSFALLGTLSDVEIRRWSMLFLYAVPLAFLVILWYCWLETKTLRRASGMVLMLLMIVYSFNAPLAVNCQFDRGEPERTYGRIESMYEYGPSRRRGRRTHFVVNMDAMQEHYEVPHDMYESAQIGDEVVLLTYPGLLGIEYEKLQMAE